MSESVFGDSPYILPNFWFLAKQKPPRYGRRFSYQTCCLISFVTISLGGALETY
jgi:hypothetical protein